ncbi:MAG: sulfurtransferase TusA family protein [Chloroflexi bacterium]|nr:sulfurtransferase TusA family protein [Chloroflexota bacterium]
MGQITIDVRGETCPIPLIEFRKAVRQAQPGDVLVITGTHPASQKEIPMAAEALETKVVSVEGSPDNWTIRVQR